MKNITPADVQLVLREYLRGRLVTSDLDLQQDLPDDCDLLLTGLIDSLGLLELISTLTTHFGRRIAFEDLDPEQLTVVGSLCTFVAQQLNYQ